MIFQLSELLATAGAGREVRWKSPEHSSFAVIFTMIIGLLYMIIAVIVDNTAYTCDVDIIKANITLQILYFPCTFYWYMLHICTTSPQSELAPADSCPHLHMLGGSHGDEYAYRSFFEVVSAVATTEREEILARTVTEKMLKIADVLDTNFNQQNLVSGVLKDH